ncbi:MAG: hypothetical protein ACI8W6_001380, partial [Porticoccaceae bacterium]
LPDRDRIKFPAVNVTKTTSNKQFIASIAPSMHKRHRGVTRWR